MTNAQYHRIRDAKYKLRNIYLHFAPACHYDLSTLARHKNDAINEVAGRIPQYATYGLHEYCEAMHNEFERKHLVQVYVTPIGKLVVGKDAYRAYVDKITPKGFTEQNNRLETVYRDDYEKIYFASEKE